MADDLRTLLHQKATELEATIEALEIMPDHVHIFISAHPKNSPMEIVKKLKGISARLIFKKYPKFQKKEYWGKHLWSEGYYVGTAGVITAQAIQKYIMANQSKFQEDDMQNSSNH